MAHALHDALAWATDESKKGHVMALRVLEIEKRLGNVVATAEEWQLLPLALDAAREYAQLAPGPANDQFARRMFHTAKALEAWGQHWREQGRPLIPCP